MSLISLYWAKLSPRASNSSLWRATPPRSSPRLHRPVKRGASVDSAEPETARIKSIGDRLRHIIIGIVGIIAAAVVIVVEETETTWKRYRGQLATDLQYRFVRVRVIDEDQGELLAGGGKTGNRLGRVGGPGFDYRRQSL